MCGIVVIAIDDSVEGTTAHPGWGRQHTIIVEHAAAVVLRKLQDAAEFFGVCVGHVEAHLDVADGPLPGTVRFTKLALCG